jgi:tetratricopeptide (TPR) repeat protein
MTSESQVLEREASSFLSQGKHEEAFRLYRKAAEGYRAASKSELAALCFASAASCWNKKYGDKTFYNAAYCYERAAKEAERTGDYEYAALLYKHAAINHEMDTEFLNFSDCFYRSKESYRRFLAYSLVKPSKIKPINKTQEQMGMTKFARRLFFWFILTFSFLLWGHGERPSRTFFSALAIIVISAFIYTAGLLRIDEIIFRPNFLEALYFSMVTFTTLGYGDVIPHGAARAVAMIEAFSGLFIMPLFIVGLTRKYLRF